MFARKLFPKKERFNAKELIGKKIKGVGTPLSWNSSDQDRFIVRNIFIWIRIVCTQNVRKTFCEFPPFRSEVLFFSVKLINFFLGQSKYQKVPGDSKGCREVVLKEFGYCHKHFPDYLLEIIGEVGAQQPEIKPAGIPTFSAPTIPCQVPPAPRSFSPLSVSSEFSYAISAPTPKIPDGTSILNGVRTKLIRVMELLDRLSKEALDAKKSDPDLFQRKNKLIPKFQEMKAILQGKFDELRSQGYQCEPLPTSPRDDVRSTEIASIPADETISMKEESMEPSPLEQPSDVSLCPLTGSTDLNNNQI